MKHTFYFILTLYFYFLGLQSIKAQNFDGNWKGLGYGRLLTIDNNLFQITDVTSISCIPSMKGNVSEFNDKITVTNDTLAIINGINTYYFYKTDDQNCNSTFKKKTKDPVYNFEVLAETFKNHYAYFEERNINWGNLYQKYRSQVSSNTSEPELYLIIKNMLDEFGDGHITFSASDKIEEKAMKLAHKTPEEQQIKKIPSWKLAEEVAETILDTIKSKRGGTLRWGILKNNIGYLQINQMLGYGKFGVEDNASVPEFWKAYIPIMVSKSDLELTYDELNGVSSILDEVMSDLKNTKGIIIDARFNGGGKDEIGLELLSRFSAKKTKIGIKKAVYNNAFSPEVPIFIEMSKNPYTNPVCILTSKATASASEIFIIASLSLENSTRIGGTTEGITSDKLEKTLPNGWEFSLSNEIYLDNSGNNYEHIGITPNVIIYNTNTKQEQFQEIKNELENKRDSAIAKALEILN